MWNDITIYWMVEQRNDHTIGDGAKFIIVMLMNWHLHGVIITLGRQGQHNITHQ